MKIRVLETLFNKVAGLRQTLVLCCVFCESFKNTSGRLLLQLVTLANNKPRHMCSQCTTSPSYKLLDQIQGYQLNFSRDELNSLSFLFHFMPLISFYAPRKHQKTRVFLVFSGGIARNQWHEMG